ncbi:MAG: hypothetical protein WC282_01040 [Bacilli bacterium]|jgi:M6 family metalloprotease-like protein
MEKNKSFIGLLLSMVAASLIILSSCSYAIPSYVPYNAYIIDDDAHVLYEGEGYYKLGDYEPLTYLNGEGVEESFSDFTEVYRHGGTRKSVRATGRQKLLVIPVDFDDYPSSSLGEGTEGSLEVLRNTFFGINENANWRSVAGYYNETSYGKLILDGKVSKWYRSSFKAADIRNAGQNSSTVRDIYNDALTWYQSEYGDLSSYYVDGDPVNKVPVYLIYSHPIETGDDARDKMFWAFTLNQNNVLTCWSSYSLTYLSHGKTDTHTYIHEVGHLLGLEDYYNTNGEAYGPTGRADMMDYSVGDHTGYSKMLLDWTRPYAVTDSCEITISPFYSSGDLILINDSWNQTAMEEYLLLEFYSPNGLNAHDAKPNYSSPRLMSEAGIKVYHVDSRPVFYAASAPYSPLGYVQDGGYSKTDKRVKIAHSNTSSKTINGNILYHLLESSGENTFLNGDIADNQTLFKKGDTFGVDTFVNYAFHDGTYLGYTFTISDLTNTYAKITINKI